MVVDQYHKEICVNEVWKLDEVIRFFLLIGRSILTDGLQLPYHISGKINLHL